MDRLTSVVEEFARSSQAQAKRRASPRSIGQRDPSLRWPHLYDILRAKGYSKEKAARIANSRLRYRKKGRLEGLPYKQADNPGALKKVLAEQNRKKKSRTASALVAACYDKSCAPPPVGKGGSSKGGAGGKAGIPARDRPMYNGGYRAAMGSDPAAAMQKADENGYPQSWYKGFHDSAGGHPKGHSYGVTEAASAPKTSKSKTHQIITAAEARGDSKPVSAEEFQRLATEGQAKLDSMRASKSPILHPLDGDPARETINKLKSDTYQEVQSEWGGATIDLHDGSVVPQGANRYAMTVKSPGMETESIPIGSSEDAFNTAFNKAKAKFESVLEYENHYLGVFRDDDVGRIDFDPVIVVDNLSDVHTIGAATRAIGGAYNFADGNGYWPPHVKDS